MNVLNAALEQSGEQPVAMNRFRPNIVVEGVTAYTEGTVEYEYDEGAAAYDEDYWRKLQIENLTVYVVRACARCPIPDIPQEIGQRTTERPVMTALRKTRQGIDLASGTTGEFFGQHLTHVFEPGTTIRVGDLVEVTERSNDRNIVLTV